MRTRYTVTIISVFVLAAAGAGGCIWFDASRAIKEAARSVDEAQALGATEHAPYLYSSAARLLEGARTEYAESDFPMAIELARKAREQAFAAGAEASKAKESRQAGEEQ